MDLIQFQQNLLSIDVWELLRPIIQNRIGEIERMNKEQLSEGIGSDGNETGYHTGSPMSLSYVDSKIERGVYPESLYPVVNLYNTGDFYRGITAYLEDEGITIESNDEKALKLEEDYGVHIYGLTPENLAKFTKALIEPLVQSIRREMFKN